ncbi:hypothetical protein KIPB_000212 [Kipferlia bialata]|uniref:Uncharacterized protein n=1 Tax=Kipferlia bialata TaxID=797122 RepID=A0A9K3CNX0_9EUKA|nr:hypothetical protein KIPB_000212 [Kipferlia bialata]|eukprot:g212.t1
MTTFLGFVDFRMGWLSKAKSFTRGVGDVFYPERQRMDSFEKAFHVIRLGVERVLDGATAHPDIVVSRGGGMSREGRKEVESALEVMAASLLAEGEDECPTECLDYCESQAVLDTVLGLLSHSVPDSVLCLVSALVGSLVTRLRPQEQAQGKSVDIHGHTVILRGVRLYFDRVCSMQTSGAGSVDPSETRPLGLSGPVLLSCVSVASTLAVALPRPQGLGVFSPCVPSVLAFLTLLIGRDGLSTQQEPLERACDHARLSFLTMCRCLPTDSAYTDTDADTAPGLLDRAASLVLAGLLRLLMHLPLSSVDHPDFLGRDRPKVGRQAPTSDPATLGGVWQRVKGRVVYVSHFLAGLEGTVCLDLGCRMQDRLVGEVLEPYVDNVLTSLTPFGLVSFQGQTETLVEVQRVSASSRGPMCSVLYTLQGLVSVARGTPLLSVLETWLLGRHDSETGSRTVGGGGQPTWLVSATLTGPASSSELPCAFARETVSPRSVTNGSIAVSIPHDSERPPSLPAVCVFVCSCIRHGALDVSAAGVSLAATLLETVTQTPEVPSQGLLRPRHPSRPERQRERHREDAQSEVERAEVERICAPVISMVPRILHHPYLHDVYGEGYAPVQSFLDAPGLRAPMTRAPDTDPDTPLPVLTDFFSSMQRSLPEGGGHGEGGVGYDASLTLQGLYPPGERACRAVALDLACAAGRVDTQCLGVDTMSQGDTHPDTEAETKAETDLDPFGGAEGQTEAGHVSPEGGSVCEAEAEDRDGGAHAPLGVSMHPLFHLALLAVEALFASDIDYDECAVGGWYWTPFLAAFTASRYVSALVRVPSPPLVRALIRDTASGLTPCLHLPSLLDVLCMALQRGEPVSAVELLYDRAADGVLGGGGSPGFQLLKRLAGEEGRRTVGGGKERRFQHRCGIRVRVVLEETMADIEAVRMCLGRMATE